MRADFASSPYRWGIDSPPRGLDASRHLAGDSAHRPQHLVSRVSGGVEHARAASLDDSHAVLASVIGCRRGNAAGPKRRLVHPHSLDAQFPALAHRRIRGFWLGPDDDPVHTAGYRLQIGVARITLDFVGVRVDGEAW